MLKLNIDGANMAEPVKPERQQDTKPGSDRKAAKPANKAGKAANK